MSPTVLLIGTLDTKGDEYAFLRDRLTDAGVDVLLADVGTLEPARATPDITREEVAAGTGADLGALAEARDRGAAVTAMADAAAVLAKRLHDEGRIDGVLAAGGSGNTAIATRAMQALPVGVPKLMVSTMAAGDTRDYVGARDVAMMASVADVAGVNSVSARVLANAAAAMAGMVSAAPVELAEERPLVGATMFGVTTPCLTTAREELERLGYEPVIFHATGVGGQAMEGLMESGFLRGVLDVTTTELCDDLVGGVLSAGPDRLEMAGRLGLPQVVSVGALDMVNFGARDTVPERFEDRNLYVHNPSITLMRTTKEENAELGRRIASKLSAATGPTALFIPLGGVSMIDAEGQPFHDPEADAALFEELRKVGRQRRARRDGGARERPGVRQGDGREARRVHGRGSEVTGDEARAKLRATLDGGGVIIGAGAGTGLSAKCAEAGGTDLIIIYNSGRYRMAGRGSLAGLMPYGDANAIVMDMASEVLPVVKDTPVLAGVCGTDPFRLIPNFLRDVRDAGFAGVQNFPTVGLIDGTFRANLEETGMGYDLEVEMIAAASELGLLTSPYVFDPESAEAMARAGADVLVPHMGLTTKGTIGAHTAKTLDECVEEIQAMRDAAVAVNPDVIVLCHGGPLAEPEDAAYVLERTTGVVGFFGASSMERLPTEVAMTENMKRFKALAPA